MKSTRTWTTEDGKIFATKADAAAHEATTPILNVIREQAPDIDDQIVARVVGAIKTAFEIRKPIARKARAKKDAPAS